MNALAACLTPPFCVSNVWSLDSNTGYWNWEHYLITSHTLFSPSYIHYTHCTSDKITLNALLSTYFAELTAENAV